MKKNQEWFINAPWGKLALVSWGKRSGPPVLLVHGRQDSLSTFVPLLKLLPDDYHFVGIDLPGHGRSDPYPPSVALSRLHFVSAVEETIKHLMWTNFTFLAHSMGVEIGLFYNVIHPNKIKKIIMLDPAPLIKLLSVPSYSHLFKSYEEYYNNYDEYNSNGRLYSERRAIEGVMKARGLSDEQAKLVLERNLIKIGDDVYRLSWDKRLRQPISIYLPKEFLCKLFSQNSVPTLVISAKQSKIISSPYKEASEKIFMDLSNSSSTFHVIYVDGGHDVHITSPELFAREISDFLSNKFCDVKSKL